MGDFGPLHGIRVIDLTSVVLGPVATHVLGDLGADVIKVEAPEGDLMRANGVSRNKGMSSIFLSINRNKRSLSIDMKTGAGREVMRRLIIQSQVLVHNMRVKAIERLGFGYEAAKALNPHLIYCVATGFGQDGPYRDHPAFDDIIQSACGLVALNRDHLDRAEYAPSLIADKTIGIYLANAVLAALVHRLRTGEGQQVEVPMYETMTAFLLAEHLGTMTFPDMEGPAGYSRVLSGGRRPVKTIDGHISLLPYTADHWVALLTETGHQQAIERFAVRDRHARNRHLQELYALLSEIIAKNTTSYWMDCCQRLDIPATPIYALEELPEHPHLKAVNLFEKMTHPSEGEIIHIRPTMKFSQSPASFRRPAPRLGQHSGELMLELGFSQQDIETMIEQRAVFQAP
ncbi:MAG: CoA transferase [Betaproteobacteria bacterium]|nr:CoA transferase [Pseudomonadota bacterium]NBQ78030.1 CoA transferase [Betaproteobacteria bacterium]NDE53531.1 CoA transferase [Actinomycetota bacterium]NBQ95461.1 CoA transferase [Betaproteobacteria bacterium]NBS38679.1 CoA transferase [Betaproteobacteria bacterium]